MGTTKLRKEIAEQSIIDSQLVPSSYFLVSKATERSV